ncbi:molecular chaperone DnaJ [Coriobacteriales bacterium OH1046]|nr:molecular chaperone DnaJ [Coriobacteriales bacterium OH1046]
MEPKRDYYEVLGVARDADQKTVKRAFLRLARTLHPDVNDAPDAEERFKEVNEAYSVLSDERKRSNYDRYGNPDGPAGFGGDYADMSDFFGGGFGINDIFDSFFGGMGSSRAGSSVRTRGRDMGIRLSITLEEAASGCSKTISYDRLAPCDDCGGSGVAEGGSVRTCERCHGTGRVVEVQRTIFGQMQSQTTCPVCHGAGHTVDHPCETCGGSGRAPEKETVELRIPAGVRTGQTVSVTGMGEAGVRGDGAGDLVASIEVVPHERFERQGDNLICTVSIDALEAIVGTCASVAGIMDGEDVAVDISPGTQFGERIICHGHGMPNVSTGLRGDLIALIQIITPTDLGGSDLAEIERIVAAHALSKIHVEGSGSARKSPRSAKKGRPRKKRP